MNETDINEYDAVRLVSKRYAKGAKEAAEIASERVRHVFIGDIHGDLHQLMGALVRYNVIVLDNGKDENECVKLASVRHMINDMNEWIRDNSIIKRLGLNNKWTTKMLKSKLLDDKSLMVPIPKYTINERSKWLCDDVIILGDIINEWINSRTITMIVHDLLTNEISKNGVIFVIGNHDARIIGNYLNFIKGDYNLTDIPALWCTLKKTLTDVRVRLVRDRIISDELDANEYVWLYVLPIFWNLHDLYVNKRIHLCYFVNDVCKNGAIVSHTFWSPEIIRRMVMFNPKTLNDIMLTNAFNGQYVNERIDKYKNIERFVNMDNWKEDRFNTDTIKRPSVNDIDIRGLVDEINICFYNKPYGFLIKSLVFSNRFVYGINQDNNVGNIYNSFIVGHSYPDECSDIGINIGRDLEQKLLGTPTYHGGMIYFFDFRSSAGYDTDSISKPCFVECNGDTFELVRGGRYKFGFNNGTDVMVEFDKNNIYNADGRIIWT
jgi:hypothetical protein